MIGVVFLVLAFAVLLRQFAVVEKSGEVFAVSRHSLAVIRSRELNDESKEKAIQHDAKQMFRLFFVLTVRGAAALLLPVGVLWVADQLGWISLSRILDTAASPACLIGGGIVALLAILIPTREPRQRI